MSWVFALLGLYMAGHIVRIAGLGSALFVCFAFFISYLFK